MEEKEGKIIYNEGKIEVRTHDRDPDAHNIWIGDNYFLFQRGCLEQFAIRTQACDLERALGNYNPSIPYVLKQERVTPESFALVLSHALEKEEKDFEKFVKSWKR